MAAPLSVRRFWLTNSFISALFLIVIYQLIQLTVIRRPALLEVASKQHYLTVEVPPLRGQILDRNHKELATNLKVPSIYAVPRLMSKADRPELAQKIAKILNLAHEMVLERLNRDKSFVWLKRRVSVEEAQAIRKLSSPALGIIEEYRRFYPQGDLLSHVLGFTDIDTAGLEGLELYLNRELQGRPGRRLTKRDALGREIKAFEMKSIPAIDGHRVTLTVDQYMQYLTERALDRAFTTWKALGATAIVMEVKTGKIVAIANRPKFDPNRLHQSQAADRRNRAVTDMYEPGSVFKIVAASAALNENKISPETLIDCENGEYRYGSRVLHDVHAYGQLSFEDVIVKSSNIGTVKIAAMMTPEIFQSYIDAFGFGRYTGVDLPGEAPGFTRQPSQWSKTSPYNIPMGQEVMVTALQMTAAMGVIANDGKLMKPYIIEEIADQDGVLLRENHPFVVREVLRPEIAQIMRRILVRVVEEGTGKKAQINGIPVGGKTGTAQKVLPGGRGYSHSNFFSSFVGFAPADDPEFVMTVLIDDPRPLYYGGTVAAPVFKEVMEAALLSMNYLPKTAKSVEPSKPLENFQENQPPALLRKAAGTAV